MGPSGSGKTTLLNIVAGIDRPTSGRVAVDGRDVLGMSESERTAWRTRTIGYVFQFHNLMPVLTAYENVELPLLLLPLSRKERHDHVLAALEAVGLLDRQGHFPRQLSGGQAQRVAIARAIVTDARILLADEPTGNLDAESAKEVMTLLKRLNQEYHKTILTVTHDANAAGYADRALRLEKGQLIAVPAAAAATA
jgi:putative ABC transport system ATP-binding protein